MARRATWPIGGRSWTVRCRPRASKWRPFPRARTRSAPGGRVTEHSIGVIMNGVTGRMGLNQHLRRSILEIVAQGGVKTADGGAIVPRPMLVGRNAAKLEALARKSGGLTCTSDPTGELKGPEGTMTLDPTSTDRLAASVVTA